MTPQLNLQLGQRQVLSTQQQQSLALLSVNALELGAVIRQELMHNPVVEEAAPDEEPGDPTDLPSDLQSLLQSDTEVERLRDFAMASIPQTSSLLSDLLEQALIAPEGVTALLESLDERGYLPPTTPESPALLWVHDNITPAGIGARNLIECLTIQLKRRGQAGSLAGVILKHAKDEFLKYNISAITALLGQPEETVRRALRVINRLNPYPGMEANVSPAACIEITFDDSGEFEVINEHIPRLTINRTYRAMLKTARDVETQEWLTERIKAGRSLIQALQRRQSTIAAIATYLLQHQRAFIEGGFAFLRPMTMTQIGDALNLHETTIGRAVNGKWAAASWGQFPLRAMFTAPMSTATGETVSNLTIKERIRAIIVTSPRINDEELAVQLTREGFQVARRTVTKYRMAMGIPAFTMR